MGPWGSLVRLGVAVGHRFAFGFQVHVPELADVRVCGLYSHIYNLGLNDDTIKYSDMYIVSIADRCFKECNNMRKPTSTWHQLVLVAAPAACTYIDSTVHNLGMPSARQLTLPWHAACTCKACNM